MTMNVSLQKLSLVSTLCSANFSNKASLGY